MSEQTVEHREQHMVTTVDNPYNPFTDFNEWNVFDQTAGYHTLSFMARIIVTSDDLSEADQSLAIEQAVDEIVEANILGLYRKVSFNPDDPTTVITTNS